MTDIFITDSIYPIRIKPLQESIVKKIPGVDVPLQEIKVQVTEDCINKFGFIEHIKIPRLLYLKYLDAIKNKKYKPKYLYYMPFVHENKNFLMVFFINQAPRHAAQSQEIDLQIIELSSIRYVYEIPDSGLKYIRSFEDANKLYCLNSANNREVFRVQR